MKRTDSNLRGLDSQKMQNAAGGKEIKRDSLAELRRGTKLQPSSIDDG